MTRTQQKTPEISDNGEEVDASDEDSNGRGSFLIDEIPKQPLDLPWRYDPNLS